MFRMMLVLFGWIVSRMMATDDPAGTPDPADPAEGKTDSPAPFKVFATKQEHDDHVNSLVQQRLERKDAKLEEDKERIEREARERALKDNEDWKALAQTHAETIAKHERKIEGLQSQVQQQAEVEDRNKGLETRLRGIIKPKLEQVPELFRPFVESMNVEEQAEWFEKNADKLDPAQATTTDDDDDNGPAWIQRPAGQPPTGSPATGGKDPEKEAQARREQSITGISRI